VGFTKFKIPHKLGVLNLDLPSTLNSRTKDGFLRANFGQKGHFYSFQIGVEGKNLNALVS